MVGVSVCRCVRFKVGKVLVSLVRVIVGSGPVVGVVMLVRYCGGDRGVGSGTCCVVCTSSGCVASRRPVLTASNGDLDVAVRILSITVIIMLYSFVSGACVRRSAACCRLASSTRLSARTC